MCCPGLKLLPREPRKNFQVGWVGPVLSSSPVCHRLEDMTSFHMLKISRFLPHAKCGLISLGLTKAGAPAVVVEGATDVGCGRSGVVCSQVGGSM